MGWPGGSATRQRFQGLTVQEFRLGVASAGVEQACEVVRAGRRTSDIQGLAVQGFGLGVPAGGFE